MRELYAATARSVAATWRKDAEARRERTQLDAVADVLESCASELESELARVDAATRTLTVEQYAKEAHVDPSSVRRWCARGELNATRNDKGEWVIPRDAHRQRAG